MRLNQLSSSMPPSGAQPRAPIGLLFAPAEHHVVPHVHAVAVVHQQVRLRAVVVLHLPAVVYHHILLAGDAAALDYLARCRVQAPRHDPAVEERRPPRRRKHLAIPHDHAAIDRPGRLQPPERPHQTLGRPARNAKPPGRYRFARSKSIRPCIRRSPNRATMSVACPPGRPHCTSKALGRSPHRTRELRSRHSRPSQSPHRRTSAR